MKELNFKEVVPFRGYNESSHYNGIFGYDSVIGPPDTIKFDVGLRGDLILEPTETNLKTLLISSISNKEIFPNIVALTLTMEEVYAEKFRAALTREPCAIRDFFDVEKIIESGFNIFNENFISLVKKKINFDPSVKIDLTFEKRKNIDSQIDSDLKPVLMKGSKFSIEKSWSILSIFVEKLKIDP